MASVTNSAGKSTGSGLVLAQDRTAYRAAARRHSLIVRGLRVLLPVATLGMLASYGLGVVSTAGLSTALDKLDVPQIVADNLAMENPHYEGFNKDGGKYWVTAKTASQNPKNLSVINLNSITGELTGANKERTQLTAARGTLDHKQNIVELFDAIDVNGDNGLKAKLTRATIKTKENVITSDQPVRVEMPSGVITADTMTIRQKSKEYTFVQNVVTDLKARETAGAKEPAQTTAPFANSNAPITIKSNRLDVNDMTKTAMFSGGVEAVQSGSTLATSDLEVSYESEAAQADPANKTKAPATTGALADPGSGKVKRVLARNPVTMTQPDGKQANARSADFDVATQKAVLDGDVVMTELPDRKAVGDKAEIDQTSGTVLLTGPVAVTQGQNELRGRRLFVNRTSGKMNLTAPGAAGGRISARFVQNGQAAGQQHGKKSQSSGNGMAFSGSFRADPNAPVDVSSERLDVDDRARQAVFTGSVKAHQEGFDLAAAELVADYTGSAGFGDQAQAGAKSGEAAKLTRIQARRNVEVTSKDGQKATGDAADFDTKNNTVVLTGNVVLTQGRNVVRGTKLLVDLTTGESTISTEGVATQPMTSSSQGDGQGTITKTGRPSAVFYPNEVKEKAGNAAQKAIDGWSAQNAPNKP